MKTIHMESKLVQGRLQMLTRQVNGRPTDPVASTHLFARLLGVGVVWASAFSACMWRKSLCICCAGRSNEMCFADPAALLQQE